MLWNGTQIDSEFWATKFDSNLYQSVKRKLNEND